MVCIVAFELVYPITTIISVVRFINNIFIKQTGNRALVWEWGEAKELALRVQILRDRQKFIEIIQYYQKNIFCPGRQIIKVRPCRLPIININIINRLNHNIIILDSLVLIIL